MASELTEELFDGCVPDSCMFVFIEHVQLEHGAARQRTATQRVTEKLGGVCSFSFPHSSPQRVGRAERRGLEQRPQYCADDNEEKEALLGCCCGRQNLSPCVSQNNTSRKSVCS